MKSIAKKSLSTVATLLTITMVGVAVAQAQPPQVIQQVLLDDRTAVSVPVATNRVTTISFPSAIAVRVDDDGPRAFLDRRGVPR